MKVIFEKGNRKLSAEAHTNEAARLFLDLRGGGYNEQQTALAIEDQRAVMDGEPITVNGVYVYLEDD